MIKITEIYTGKKYRIFAIEKQNRCQVKDFIDGLSEIEQKKIVKLLQFSADYGLPKNEKKFKKLEKDIWEFKSNQIRILCFIERERMVILTHGFLKKSGRTPKREIEKAQEIHDIYYKR